MLLQVLLVNPKIFQIAFGHGARRNPLIPRRRRILLHDIQPSVSPTMAFSSSSSSSSSTSAELSAHHDIETVTLYHDKTKHSFRKYADGPHGLDWANQPSPFRLYHDSLQVPLLHFPPDLHPSEDMPYSQAFSAFRPASMPSKPTISRLLYDSFSLSAWKKAGLSTWSLRVNPSSGNLHPTEVYLVSDAIAGISERPFVAHYYPREHALEMRCEVPGDLWEELKKDLPDGVVFVGLSSIFWRESWKYGERAFRYCNHDVGHALGAVSMAAAGLGWDAILLDGWGNADLDFLLGTFGRDDAIPPGSPRKGKYPQLEQEHADCLVACFPVIHDNPHSAWRKDVAVHVAMKRDVSVIDEPMRGDAIAMDDNQHAAQRRHVTTTDSNNPRYTSIQNVMVPSLALLPLAKQQVRMSWMGLANHLSKDHVWWEIIDKAAAAAKKTTSPSSVSTKPIPTQTGFSGVYSPHALLRQVIIKRRSAVNMDGKHVMSSQAFYQIMLKSLPSGPGGELQGETAQIPFRILPWNAEVHMAIFVHRVEGLPSGIYILVRNHEHESKLKKLMRHYFKWEKPKGCPKNLRLYLLAEGNCENLAMQLSCHQEIAAYGCFSLGMIARFEAINERGAWMYPRLFWECGLLGQLLYLEAHALGIAATGIGCYFDDPVHEILGLEGKEFQSLYHFTIGAPVEDRRITGLPPYPAPKYAKE